VYTVNGEETVSNNGNVVILPKGLSYEWVCREAGHCAIVDFEGDFEHDRIFSFKIKDSMKILKMFREIEYKRTVKKAMYDMESICDCYSIILEVVRSGGRRYSPSEKQKKIVPAIEYIVKNYNKKLTNDELAKICGLSTVYFRKIFADVLGISPILYIQELRIKKAKGMLQSDYGSISDVALSLGYTSIYDFSRAFKKSVGVSPMQYAFISQKKE
jgi:AraC-like DNA-binding protein